MSLVLRPLIPRPLDHRLWGIWMQRPTCRARRDVRDRKKGPALLCSGQVPPFRGFTCFAVPCSGTSGRKHLSYTCSTLQSSCHRASLGTCLSAAAQGLHLLASSLAITFSKQALGRRLTVIHRHEAFLLKPLLTLRLMRAYRQHPCHQPKRKTKNQSWDHT